MNVRIKHLHLSLLLPQAELTDDSAEKLTAKLTEAIAFNVRDFLTAFIGVAESRIMEQLNIMAKGQKELQETINQLGTAANDFIGRANKIIDELKAKNAQTSEVDLSPQIDQLSTLTSTFHAALAGAPDVQTVPPDAPPPTEPVLPAQPTVIADVPATPPADAPSAGGVLDAAPVANPPSQ